MSGNRTYPWQLPDGIDELLPDRAAHLEKLRRRLLDRAAGWGYELVMPPLAEFTDSLLVGAGEDLDLLTFKVPDQLSGRTLGVRADITPQVARMDAHSLSDRAVNRLCYAGSTLHTRSRSLLASRSPMQLGAELYGVPDLAGDLEVIDLMLTLLHEAGIDAGAAAETATESALTLDLGHSSVFSHVLAACETQDRELDARLFDALQRKSLPDLKRATAELPVESAALLTSLLGLHGDLAVLDQAEEQLLPAVPALAAPLAELRQLAATLSGRYPKLELYIDLGELRGYRYHTGVVFAVYREGLGEALARGGRYDNVGAVYGRARPATGFAMDLRVLARELAPEILDRSAVNAISAPALDNDELQAQVARLRAAGEVVIVQLGESPDPRCGRELILDGDHWTLRDCSAVDRESD